MFETVEGWWGTLKNAASSVGDSWGPSVDDLKKKAAEFVAVSNQLRAMRAASGISGAEASLIDSLLARADSVRKTVARITGSIDSVASVIPKNLLGGAVSSGKLGILPLLPVAAIAAAISVITAWLSDAYVEIERLKLAERVRQDGGSAEKLLNSAEGGGGAISWKVAVPAGIAVVGLIYMLSKNNGRY